MIGVEPDTLLGVALHDALAREDDIVVRRVLGRGGMGEVLLVHHRFWNLDVAMKQPRPERLGAWSVEAFINEAEVWVGIGAHPHIVQCLYVSMMNGCPRIFLEYVDGGSLSDAIAGPLYVGGEEAALERILDIAIQCAWGLDFAHSLRLVHQDFKPANVMLVAESGAAGYTAKVTDFGLVRATRRQAVAIGPEAEAGEPSTLFNELGGLTRAYASPEQELAFHDPSRHVTRRTDLWSWAVSILEIFSGAVTWGNGSAAPHVLHVLRAGPPREGLPALPADLADVLERCLVFEESERIRTAGELADQLIACYERCFQRRHSRPRPQSIGGDADGPNNRGASLIEIGRLDDADAALTHALAFDPQHAHATYNRALLRWRRGVIDDTTAVAEVEHLAEVARGREDEWEVHEFLARLHAERGDYTTVRAALKQSLDVARTPEVRAMVERRLGDQPMNNAEVQLVLDVEGLRAIGLSADGAMVLAAGKAGVQARDAATGALLHVRTDISPGRLAIATAAPVMWVEVKGAILGLSANGLGTVATFEDERVNGEGYLGVSSDGEIVVYGNICDCLVFERGRPVRSLPFRFVRAADGGRHYVCSLRSISVDAQRRLVYFGLEYSEHLVHLDTGTTVAERDGRQPTYGGLREAAIDIVGFGASVAQRADGGLSTGTSIAEGGEVEVGRAVHRSAEIDGAGCFVVGTRSFSERSVRFFDLHPLRVTRSFALSPTIANSPKRIFDVCFAGQTLACATQDDRVTIWSNIGASTVAVAAFVRPTTFHEVRAKEARFEEARARSLEALAMRDFEGAVSWYEVARGIPGHATAPRTIELGSQLARHLARGRVRGVCVIARAPETWTTIEVREDGTPSDATLKKDGGEKRLAAQRISLRTIEGWGLLAVFDGTKHFVVEHPAVDRAERSVVTDSGRVIAVGPGSITVADLRSGDRWSFPTASDLSILCREPAIDEEEGLLLVGGSHVHDLYTGAQYAVLRGGPTAFVSEVELHGARFVVTRHHREQACIWYLDWTFEPRARERREDPPFDPAQTFSDKHLERSTAPRGRFLFASNARRGLNRIASRHGRLAKRLGAPTIFFSRAADFAVVKHYDNTWFASFSDRGKLTLKRAPFSAATTRFAIGRRKPARDTESMPVVAWADAGGRIVLSDSCCESVNSWVPVQTLNPVRALAVASGLKKIAWLGENGVLTIVHSRSGKSSSLKVDPDASAVALSDDGETVVTLGPDRLEVWHAADASLARRIPGGGETLQISSDAEVAVISRGATHTVIDIRSGRCVLAVGLSGGDRGLRDQAYAYLAHHGNTLVTGGLRPTVWQLAWERGPFAPLHY